MENRILDSERLHYYKKTPRYVVGGRRYIGDAIGFVLTDDQPWVAVRESQLRDFKIANKKALIDGLIVEIAEPSVEWETDNVYSDEDIDALFKKGIKEVRLALPKITSIPTVARMLERAKSQNKSEAMVTAIEERLEEIDNERVELEDVDRALDA